MSTGHISAPPSDPLVGTILADRYQIERRLGEGGMGAVYIAKHIVLDKTVALKVLHDEFSRKPDLIERFLNEAKAAARIRHEHVVDIYDFGQTPSGNVFFAMELLEGHELARELKTCGRFPWARAQGILLQICSALQAAHEAGVIHRDLKPENIYLTPRLDRDDYVKVLDFGIAKLTELEQTGRNLTRTGMVFGTPEYMSPEQARGDKTDARVDVYASGCILFEMLTGQPPYRADTFMGVLTKHLFEPIPSVKAMRDDLPPGLEEVVNQVLAKDKESRFASMNELAVALSALPGGDDGCRNASSAYHAPVPRTAAPDDEDDLVIAGTGGGKKKLLVLAGAALLVGGAVLWLMSGRSPAKDSGVAPLPVVMTQDASPPKVLEQPQDVVEPPSAEEKPVSAPRHVEMRSKEPRSPSEAEGKPVAREVMPTVLTPVSKSEPDEHQAAPPEEPEDTHLVPDFGSEPKPKPQPKLDTELKNPFSKQQ